MEIIDKSLSLKIENISRKIVDDSLRTNANFAENVGLEVRVSRRYDGVGIHDGKECQWCLDRCGENMTYQEAMEKGAFQRHPGCGCEIEYTSKKGKTTWQYGKGGQESWKDKRDKEFRRNYQPRVTNPFYEPNVGISGKDYDIIISGGRITDLYSKEADEFAKMFYEQIRKRNTDCRNIAKNTGLDIKEVKKIKNYLFYDKVLYDSKTGTFKRFDEDCAIAQSWQRLSEHKGRNILPHDRLLLKHELFEMEVKKQNPGIEHWKAHEIATRKYDYQGESQKYYDNLSKHKK